MNKITALFARQVGRLLIGQRYFAAFYQLTMVVSITKMAWNYPNELIPIFLIIGTIFIWLLGLFTDKTNFARIEQRKVVEQSIEGSKFIWREGVFPSIAPQIKEMLKEVARELKEEEK